MTATPSTTAITSQHSTLAIGSTPTPIYGLTDFSGLGSGAATVIDSSDLSSTSKQKLLGLMDEGQAKFTFHYAPGDPGQVALAAARTAGTATPLVLTLVDGSKFTFNGLVLSLEKTGSVDAIVTLAATIEITGAVTQA
jgi:hypothetical protein